MVKKPKTHRLNDEKDRQTLGARKMNFAVKDHSQISPCKYPLELFKSKLRMEKELKKQTDNIKSLDCASKLNNGTQFKYASLFPPCNEVSPK